MHQSLCGYQGFFDLQTLYGTKTPLTGSRQTALDVHAQQDVCAGNKQLGLLP